MEGLISKESDVLFALWTEKVEPTLCKLSKEGLKLTDSESTLFAWWNVVGKNGKKSKRGDIIEALNYRSYSRLRNMTSVISSIIKTRCEEFDVQKSEAEKSEAKILDLQLQLDNLLAEQLALAEKCRNQKDTIADLKAMLKAQKFVSSKMLNSNGIEKHVHFSDEVTCNKSEMICSEAVAQKSLPVSVLKVMQHQNSAVKTHGVEALESLKNPQTSDDHSNQPSGEQNRLCMSCNKIGHREEKCWTSGEGRPPPYFLKKQKSLKSKNQWSSRNKNSSVNNTLSELTALLIQGLQLLTSFAGGLAA